MKTRALATARTVALLILVPGASFAADGAVTLRVQADKPGPRWAGSR